MSDQYIYDTELDSKLTDEQKTLCDGLLTIDECTDAIFSMKTNKSPGLDGLTVEWYRKFWEKLKYILVKVLNNGYEIGQLSHSQRTSVLSLLYKKGDPTSLNNYRPISLLNVDLKLVSFVLAQRLKKVLPTIINNDQTGYIKKRFIGFNLRQIQDVIDYTESYNIEGAIVFIDFTKAFDSLEWNFMLSVLEHFGFNNGFTRWVKTLYSDIQTCVMNNGWISGTFFNSRGIRQGCPLSALIFVISVEIMALRLRGNTDINGLTIKLDSRNHSIKISQLADDTTLFCGSKRDVENSMNEIEIFGTFSGLQLNRDKTQGIWLGKLKSCRDDIAGVNWTDKPVKALGIFFGHDKKECEKKNWDYRIQKMNNLISAWKKRNLTIFGKIMIIKALIIPIFTFLVSACTVPNEYLKAVEGSCFKFIWNDKPDKVKRNTLICPFEKGGLNMIDIKSYFLSLKAAWVGRLVNSDDGRWKLLPRLYFSNFGSEWLIFKTNNGDIKLNESLKNIPEFFREVLRSWNMSGG